MGVFRLGSGVSLALALMACASPVPSPVPSPTPTFGTSPIPSPTATPSPWPSDHEALANLILEMQHSEGAPLQGLTFWPIPDFSLYDDGQAIYTTPGVPWHESLMHARLSQEQVDALVADALGPGGLSTDRSSYDDVRFESTHSFFLWDGRRAHYVSVQGLGREDSDTPSAADRARFKWLADRLSNFANDVRAGKAQPLGEYSPAGYRVWLSPPYEGTAVNAAWPWPELTGDDFRLLPNTTAPSRIVTYEQGQKVIDLGIETNLVARAPGGAAYQITIDPMLPADYRITP